MLRINLQQFREILTLDVLKQIYLQMDPPQERQLERRLTENILRELDVRLHEYQKNTEADAHVWAAPFIKNTGGEMMLFILGYQPKNVREYSNFERKHAHDNMLTRIANHLGKDNLTMCKMCDRLIIARNQSSHCGNWEELELRIAQCLRLFARFPSLILDLKDQYVILQNWELFEQAFNLRNAHPEQSSSSSSWGNHPSSQSSRPSSHAGSHTGTHTGSQVVPSWP